MRIELMYFEIEQLKNQLWKRDNILIVISSFRCQMCQYVSLFCSALSRRCQATAIWHARKDTGSGHLQVHTLLYGLVIGRSFHMAHIIMPYGPYDMGLHVSGRQTLAFDQNFRVCPIFTKIFAFFTRNISFDLIIRHLMVRGRSR